MLIKSSERQKPLFVVLTGPVGAGKKLVFNRMRDQNLPFFFALKSTSRKSQSEERRNADNILIPREDLEEAIMVGDVLEYSIVYG